jgi:hypothetical protein
MLKQIKHMLTGAQDGNTGNGQRRVSPSGKHDVPTADKQTQSSLFRCTSCKSVYIAREKETCETCDADVTEIQSTLRTQRSE